MTVHHCPHANVEPVEVRNHITGGTDTVAHICRDCLEQLPAGWGCPDCKWGHTDVSTLGGDVHCFHHLVIPCVRHAA